MANTLLNPKRLKGLIVSQNTLCSLTRKTKRLQLWRENGENGWTGQSWVNANTQEVVFALKQCPPVCKTSPELSAGVGGGEAGEGMQRSDNLPYACCSHRCQPFSARALCLLRGERVPFSADHKKGGGGVFSKGVLISIALTQKKLKPPFPIEITVHRKSVPKPRGGGLSLNPSKGHLLPPAWKLLATEQL